jgi:hypothetical protein
MRLKSFGKKYLYYVWAGLATCISPNLWAASAAIEIMPIAVWQGKPSRAWNTAQLEDLRQKFPQEKFAHAVSAAGLLLNQTERLEYLTNITKSIREGDDILLHIAPWRSLFLKNRVSFKLEPTLFGPPINLDDCQNDCGLELNVTAYSPDEISGLSALSLSLLSKSGFGAPAAIYFDQGVVPTAYRRAVLNHGIKEDWSGIENGQLKSNLSRFPLYESYEASVKQVTMMEQSRLSDGLHTDHLLFGIHSEIADLESSTLIVKNAIDHAKKFNRVVRVPIVFNVEDLVHTHGFVSQFIAEAHKMVQESGLTEQVWQPQNTSWSLEKMKREISASAIAIADVEKSKAVEAEAEFYSEEELKALQDSAQSNGNTTNSSDHTAH